ncbi:MAG TPA: long-chain fatty acid--CoA ligase [Bacteroidales bacterium]|nr:long-chain fatty acid--CoA ligase [Bacteroidales bacterium]
MEPTRTFDLLENYKKEYAYKQDALAAKENGTWVKYSSGEYVANTDYVSYGLLALGLKKGDRIATISNNRPEWNFADMGMSQAGIIHVPIYPTLSEGDYEYILNHAEPSLIIISDKMLYDRIGPIARKVASIKEIYTFNNIEGSKNWKEILELGKQNEAKYKEELERIKKEINPEEMVTIIYTSGTTGNPKGVMLSHRNIMSNVQSVTQIFDFNHTQRTLSFLPISHVFERTVNYYFQRIGISIYYAENLGTIADNLKEIKPHIFITVPRLLEKVYDRIIGVGKDLKGIKKQIFFWAVNLGLKYKFNGQNSWFYNQKLKLARKLVFSKWCEALGGEVLLAVAGGAALQPRLATIFSAAGIPVIEGYGLTETSPVIAANRQPGKSEVRVGTVGPAIPGVEIRIAEDGEILCKGPNVMLGYYKEPGLTAGIIDKDGWLHTGDIGIMVDGKFLKITDRKKEIFKLSSGKYIAPQPIENKLKESFFIEQAMVVGENEKFASALILPNFPFLHNWCSLHDIKYRDNLELIQNPKVIARFQREVNDINKQLGVTEQIKRFRLVHEEWTPQTGELSPTLKVKRRFISDKYKHILDDIFSMSKTEETE